METFDLSTVNPVAQLIDRGLEKRNIECQDGDGIRHDPIIVLDGCHNALSVSLCVRAVRERYPAFDLWVAFGSGKDKNLESMLAAVLETSDSMIATVSKHFRALG